MNVFTYVALCISDVNISLDLAKPVQSLEMKRLFPPAQVNMLPGKWKATLSRDFVYGSVEFLVIPSSVTELEMIEPPYVKQGV